jgi:hypothetical protein
MPLRSMVLCTLLAGVTGLVWQVSGAERQVDCARGPGPAGFVTCAETESGPLVTDGHRVTEHPSVPRGSLRVAQLRSAGRTSTLWSLVVASGERPTDGMMDDTAASLVVASGFTKAWAEAKRARLVSLGAGPPGASAVFQDGWRGPLATGSLRLLGLSFVGVGVWDLRHRARAAGARAPLLWAAGGVGGLLGVAAVTLLLS